MEPAVQPRTADDPVAAAVGGIVSRRGLFERLGRGARVTQVSAPAGSGKTFLLRSWIAESGLAQCAAWVPVQPEERDPQRFWISVADALRGTVAGSGLVRPLTAAPDVDGWAIVERLLKDLAGLAELVWLVVDDVHELASAEALAQLELLVMRAPPQLRFVLTTRHDLRLGLHRLRLEGELTEIRADDLRFTPEEARKLFAGAGIELADPVLALLLERAEGWAAGLRLAALSLAGHPEPGRFAVEFSGSERTVADYLLAEVLERQSEPVRRLLLRTSVLERVNGELADLLTGRSGGGQALQQLEVAGAFVVSVDPRRSWFRYHQMFADLLQLELRRTASGELPALHSAAAEWFAGHGYPMEAVRHAQAAQNWELAARLLADHWFGLMLNGQTSTAHELLTRFPAGTVTAAEAELTVLVALYELRHGSVEEAERQLAQAARGLEASGGQVPVPAERRGRLRIFLAVVRLELARQRGDLPAVAEEVQQLLAPAEAADAAQPVKGGGEDLRALVMISLGVAEAWAARPDDADRHLEQGVALARRTGRPYLEFTGLAHWAAAAVWRSFALGEQRSRQAIELAQRHGWGDDQGAAVAYEVLSSALLVRGQLAEAEYWLERTGQTLRIEAEAAAGMGLHYVRGVLQLALGRHEDALADFQATERLASTLVTPQTFAPWMRAHMVQALLRLGQTGHAETVLTRLDSRERDKAETRTALASLRLAQHNPQAATAALAPVTNGSIPAVPELWMVTALLLEAIARDVLGDPAAAGHALERALDLAAPDRVLIPFLVHPAPGLLRRQARHRTTHTALIADILRLLTGTDEAAGPPGSEAGHEGREGNRGLQEPLSQAETRVLHYLPTSLSVTEIAQQLYLSQNTVRTHMRHLYQKLDAHRRHDAIERARTLGLLAPATRKF